MLYKSISIMTPNIYRDVQLTLRLFAQVAHELTRAVLHQALFVIAIPHRVAFYAEHFQLMQRANLIRQIVQVVLVKQQSFEIREHTDLGR